jgi:hypothetical protein
VTIAAADARKAPDPAGYPTRPGVLATGAAADSRDATLPAGTATRSAELTAGAAVAVGVAATAARVLLEDHVGRRRADRARTCLGCRHRHDSHRSGNGSTSNNRFQHTENGHVKISTPSTRAQNIGPQSW